MEWMVRKRFNYGSFIACKRQTENCYWGLNMTDWVMFVV